MSEQAPRIVFITIPGNSRRAFANALHKNTNDSVALVVVQKQNPLSFVARWKRLIGAIPIWELPRQLGYAFLLRISSRKQFVLTFFRATSNDLYKEKYIPPVIEVDSVNSDAVYKKLKEISPDLIVVWGCTVLKSRIVGTAKRVVNLHLGLCPYYRGAVANQYAILQDDFSKVGATVHYVTPKVDGGDILKTFPLSLGKSPQDAFLDLNSRAVSTYLQIATDLFYGKNVPSYPQDISLGKNILLREWTPEMRYKTAKKMLRAGLK